MTIEGDLRHFHNQCIDDARSDVIEIRRVAEGDPLDFEVVVGEGRGETRHRVTMSREMCERLTAGKHTPERCLEAVVRFLLDREPKESILARFDATVISRYFPEFEERCRVTSRGPNGIVHALCFVSSLRFAGLPGECWIPVPLPPPVPTARTFSAEYRHPHNPREWRPSSNGRLDWQSGSRSPHPCSPSLSPKL